MKILVYRCCADHVNGRRPLKPSFNLHFVFYLSQNPSLRELICDIAPAHQKVCKLIPLSEGPHHTTCRSSARHIFLSLCTPNLLRPGKCNRASLSYIVTRLQVCRSSPNASLLVHRASGGTPTHSRKCLLIGS